MKLKELLSLISIITSIDLRETGKGHLCFVYSPNDQDLQPFLEREIDIVYACAEDILQINLKSFEKTLDK